MTKTKKKQTIYSATEARKNFYNLVRDAGAGNYTYEVHLKGNEPIVLMSKTDYEALLETAEILAIPGAAESIQRGLTDYAAGDLIDLEDLDK